MLFELGQNTRNLFCRQPAVRSAKPPEEDDHTGLILPELPECCFLLGDSMGHLTVSYLCGLHTTSRNITSIRDQATQNWTRYFHIAKLVLPGVG